MPNPPTTEMGRLHEVHTAEILGGHKTGSSGNQWDDQLDGGHEHDEPFAFRWDGKSTKGKSITITIEMIEKVTEQAQGERPAMPLRWYGNEKLTSVLHDWIAVKDVDFSEILEAARNWAQVQADTGYDTPAKILHLIESAREAVARERAGAGKLKAAEKERDLLRRPLEDAQRGLVSALTEMDALRAEVERLRGQSLSVTARLDQADGAVEMLNAEGLEALRQELARYKEMAEATAAGKFIPPQVPHLPWTTVFQMHLPGRTETAGMHYAQDGAMTQFEVGEVRVERSAVNRPRLIVNNTLVRDGDLYVDGRLLVRAWENNYLREQG